MLPAMPKKPIKGKMYEPMTSDTESPWCESALKKAGVVLLYASLSLVALESDQRCCCAVK